jgi:hypothetical protein
MCPVVIKYVNKTIQNISLATYKIHVNNLLNVVERSGTSIIWVILPDALGSIVMQVVFGLECCGLLRFFV